MEQHNVQRKIPESLKNFDSLPDLANIRLPIVQILFACSASTVWRMVKRGTIPSPRKLSQRICVWNVGELRKILKYNITGIIYEKIIKN